MILPEIVSDPNILATVIAGLFAILGSIATIVFSDVWGNRRLQYLSRDRRNAISGRWIGEIRQDDGSAEKPPGKLTMELELEVKGKVVNGTAKLKYKDYKDDLAVTGGFRDSRYLKFDYDNENRLVIQYGSAVGELSADAQSLNGVFVGFGLLAQKIVSGRFNMKKVD